MEIHRSRDGSELAVLAATWELNPRISFEALASEFRANPLKAWRNYGSVVTHGHEAAIKEPDAVLNRQNLSRDTPWVLSKDCYADWFRGRRGVRYFMHFDLSKNRDSTGLALVHRERDGRLVVDFMWQHRAPEGRDISYSLLRERYVYPLAGRAFHLECVSFDGFQSDETRQVLEERGIHTDYCSADKDTGPYDTLIDYVITDRCDYYSYPVFVRELEELRLVDGNEVRPSEAVQERRPRQQGCQRRGRLRLLHGGAGRSWTTRAPIRAASPSSASPARAGAAGPSGSEL